MSLARCRVLIWLLLACCQTSGARRPEGNDAAGAVSAAPPSGAFTVTATLVVDPAFTAKFPGFAVPEKDTFALHLDGNGQGTVVASRSGSVSVARLAANGDKWFVAGPLTLAPGPGPSQPCMGWVDVNYREIVIERDGGRVRGTLKGLARHQIGDLITGAELEGSFVGEVDRSPPQPWPLAFSAHPGDGLLVRFDEALPASTNVFLVSADAHRRALEAHPGVGPRAAFLLKQPLGPAAGLRVAVEPSLVDLAGNAAADPTIPLSAVDIPLLPEDGFEGAERPFLSGGARLSMETGIYPAIAGVRSLYFAATSSPGGGVAGRASLRLRVRAGATSLKGSVRAIVNGESERRLDLGLKLVSPSGATTLLPPITFAEPPTKVEGTSTWLSPPLPIALALPEGTKSEVLVDVNRPFESCGGPSPTIVGALLDDLRIE